MVSSGHRTLYLRYRRVSTQPPLICTERSRPISSSAFEAKENMNCRNDIISLAISSSARIKTSTTKK